jgi:spermidine/putrescine transport system substrate-binding protein
MPTTVGYVARRRSQLTNPDDGETGHLTRRQAVRRGAAGAFALSSLPAFLAACGGSDSGGAVASTSPATTAASPPAASEVTGNLVIASYPDWYGPDLFKDFKAKYPGASVKQATDGDGTAAQIAQLAKNRGDYDLTLAGINACEQFKLAGLLAPFDPARVPNIELIGAEFRKAYPYGIPTDFGRTGFGYRKDLISERPTSWKELWELTAKYKNKTTMLKYDSDIQGMALKYLGYSVNTKDDAELQAMQKALLQLKPNLKAIIDTDFSKALIQGDVFFAIDYDYDIAVAQESNKDIVWVQPSEGVPAYLEGWAALSDSDHLPAVWALMNFHLEPRNYAAFVNAMGPAYTEKAAEKYIRRSIRTNPVLKYNEAALKGVEFEGFLGPEQTAKRGKLWEEFLAS